MATKTFTTEQLLEFCMSDAHTFSVDDAIKFTKQFLESQGEPLEKSQVAPLIRKWYESMGLRQETVEYLMQTLWE